MTAADNGISIEELKKLDEPCISYNGKLYTEYEVSQMQRAQERRVRAWKRRCVTAQEGVNSATDEATRVTAQAEFDRSARYLKNNEAKLKDFCRQTGQDRDRFREQVLGFNRSTAQKAVHAAIDQTMLLHLMFVMFRAKQDIMTLHCMEVQHLLNFSESRLTHIYLQILSETARIMKKGQKSDYCPAILVTRNQLVIAWHRSLRMS